jgi:hypothetical protein
MMNRQDAKDAKKIPGEIPHSLFPLGVLGVLAVYESLDGGCA